MKGLLSLVLAGAAGWAASQTATAQSSLLNYDYLFGAGGDAYQGSHSQTDTSLLSGTSHGFHFSTEGDGVFQDQPWTAYVHFFGATYYEINGDPNDFNYAFLSTLTQSDTTATGPALAIMNGSSPGVLHTMDFTVGFTRTFRLNGSLELDEGMAVGPGNVLALQRYNGNWWESVHTSFDPEPFDLEFSLDPGQYRLVNQVGARAFTNESWTNRGFIMISSNPVPEPTMLTILGLGSLALVRRRLKR